jgi:hypothetical protein
MARPKPTRDTVAKGVKTQTEKVHPNLQRLRDMPKDARRNLLGEKSPDGRYHFKKGNPGGGRTKGSLGGRGRALGWLDAILNEHQVKVSVKKALRRMALDEPIKFYKEIVMPLIPREVMQKAEGERKLSVRIVMGGTRPAEAVTPRTPPAISPQPPQLTAGPAGPAPQTGVDVEGEVIAEKVNLAHPKK